jgi:hypothetical protein
VFGALPVKNAWIFPWKEPHVVGECAAVSVLDRGVRNRCPWAMLLCDSGELGWCYELNPFEILAPAGESQQGEEDGGSDRGSE